LRTFFSFSCQRPTVLRRMSGCYWLVLQTVYAYLFLGSKSQVLSWNLQVRPSIHDEGYHKDQPIILG
jgi:hypothetical protein